VAHKGDLGLIEVAALLRDLQPVVHGLNGHLVQLLPLLLIVLHFLGEAVFQIILVECQIQFMTSNIEWGDRGNLILTIR
jgi:hypothetical protein